MSSFSKRERKREVSFCFGVVVVVVVFFVVERKRERVVVVVVVVVALSRGKESSLGRLSHPLHPKEREREKRKKKKKTHKNAQQRVFFGLFFRLFFVVFLAKQKPAKIVSFPLECDPKTKRGTV